MPERRPRFPAIGGAAALMLAALAAPSARAEEPLVIKLGTLAQEGTPWYGILGKLDEEVRRMSGGRIRFRIYPGGVLGDEPALVEKLRIGQLEAAGLTLTGLSHLDDGLLVLQVPLLYDTLDELYAVRDRMQPTFEADLKAKGFTFLCWEDVGWVYFFARRPIRTVADLRSMKLFLWAGDAWSGRLYTAASFQPVELEMGDMLPALKTGMIDAFDTVPLIALSYQWFGLAPYMTDLKWVPVSGAMVVSNATWAKIPADLQPRIVAAARRLSEEARPQILRLNDEAVTAMKKHGLTVVHLDRAQTEAWHRAVEGEWASLRGTMGPARYLDQAVTLLAAERRRAGSPASLPIVPSAR